MVEIEDRVDLRAPIWRDGTGSIPLCDVRTADLMPHRAPFLFVDRLIGWHRQDRRILAGMTVRDESAWTSGHFPGQPIFPGVLLIEAMAQAALCLLRLTEPEAVLSPRMLGIQKAEFLEAAYPGDDLSIAVRLIENTLIARCHGQVCRADRLICTGILDVMA